MRRVATTIVVLAVLAGCSAPGTSSTPTSAQATRLRLGQCTDGKATDDQAQLRTLTAAPCDQPHTYEVYAERTLEADAYPGDDQVQEDADDYCATEFETFVGVPIIDSDYDTSSVTPSAETWASGDRLVTCLAGKDDGGLTGSVKGTKA